MDHLAEVLEPDPGRRLHQVRVLERHKHQAHDRVPGEGAEHDEQRQQEQQLGYPAAPDPSQRRTPKAPASDHHRRSPRYGRGLCLLQLRFSGVDRCHGVVWARGRGSGCSRHTSMTTRARSSQESYEPEIDCWPTELAAVSRLDGSAFCSVRTASTTESRSPYTAWVAASGSGMIFSWKMAVVKGAI